MRQAQLKVRWKSPFLEKVDRFYYNASMTFRRDSDYPITYDSFTRTDNDSLLWSISEVKTCFGEVLQLEAAYAKKNETAFALISQTQSVWVRTSRVEYVQELSKFINVTKFGKAFSRKCDKTCEAELIGCASPKESVSERHFFVFAFENSVCDGYATEKFWRMKRLVVPVVLKR